jgi:hypothetical protein
LKNPLATASAMRSCPVKEDFEFGCGPTTRMHPLAKCRILIDARPSGYCTSNSQPSTTRMHPLAKCRILIDARPSGYCTSNSQPSTTRTAECFGALLTSMCLWPCPLSADRREAAGKQPLFVNLSRTANFASQLNLPVCHRKFRHAIKHSLSQIKSGDYSAGTVSYGSRRSYVGAPCK